VAQTNWALHLESYNKTISYVPISPVLQCRTPLPLNLERNPYTLSIVVYSSVQQVFNVVIVRLFVSRQKQMQTLAKKVIDIITGQRFNTRIGCLKCSTELLRLTRLTGKSLIAANTLRSHGIHGHTTFWIYRRRQDVV